MTKVPVIAALVAFSFLIGFSSGDAAAKPISDAVRKKCSAAYEACYDACPSSVVDRGLTKGCRSRCRVRYEKCGMQ